MAPNFRVRLTPQALADLDAIHAYIAKDSPQNAAAMMEQIFDAIDLLEIFPHRTVVQRQTPSLKYPVRSLPVKPYVIYFRVIEDERIASFDTFATVPVSSRTISRKRKIRAAPQLGLHHDSR